LKSCTFLTAAVIQKLRDHSFSARTMAERFAPLQDVAAMVQ